jgi:Leucine-rich repeat (LRR) protein
MVTTRVLVVLAAAAWWCCCCCCVMMPASAQPPPSPPPTPLTGIITLTDHLKTLGIIQGECTAEKEENGPCVDDPPASGRTCPELLQRFRCETEVVRRKTATRERSEFRIRDECRLSCGVCRVFEIAGQDLQDCVVSPSFALEKDLTLFSGAKISGFVPNLIWSGLTALTGVGFTGNRLTGTLPTDVGLAVNLRILDMSDNMLEGSLPSELGLLTNLLRLDLSSNAFTGPLPKELGRLKQLIVLVVSKTRLSGTIPPELFGATAMKRLALDRTLQNGVNTGLSGTLPSRIGDLQQLTWIDVSYNLLSGSLPPELWTVTKLQVLNMISASFNGTLAKEVSHRLLFD